MADDRERIFQEAVETIDLAKVPTLGGWTRKLAEVEKHRAHGHEVNDGGCLVVQATRKTDYRKDNAIDFFGCLPEKRRGVALIFASYCRPWMLVDYPGLLREIVEAGVRPTEGNNWKWENGPWRAAGSYCNHFWRRVSQRRVLPHGI